MSDAVAGASTDATEEGTLRESMIADLRGMGVLHSHGVERAIRTVPRHSFAPEAPLERAYAANASVVTKRDADGVAISSVSAPRIQALMLEQAELEPGMRVLEVGSGGYNAALVAELVGEHGEVTSVDIDPEVVSRAREHLRLAGYDRVEVVLADAEAGVPHRAPFDRILVTAGAWDVPPSWTSQLAQGGRLVVPLRVRGLTRSVVLERAADRLVSLGYELCGFVAMQGAGEHREQLVPLDGQPAGSHGAPGDHGDAVLRFDDRPPDLEPLDIPGLRRVLSTPRTTVWSGRTIGDADRFDGLHLWLALLAPDFALLAATRAAVQRGLVAHAWPLGSPTIVSRDSLAYLGVRRLADEAPGNGPPAGRRSELGAHGHGPDAERLATELVRHVRAWDGTNLDARIEVVPASVQPTASPAARTRVVGKTHTRVVVSWPER